MAVESTLSNLGIRTNRDKFNLANSRFALSKVDHTQTGEVFYLGLLYHPLSGTHFSQVLSTVAPYRANVEGIVDDFDEAKYSYRKSLEGEKGSYLDRVHREDPDVGAAYVEFFNNHLNRWKRAFGNSQYNPVFNTLQRMRFTYSIDGLIGQFSARWLIDPISSPVLIYLKEDFASYLRRESVFPSGLHETSNLSDEIILNKFRRSNWERRKGLIFEYVQHLSPEQLRELATKYIVDIRGTILVDPGKRQVLIPKNSIGVEFSFVDRERFWVRDETGSGVQIRTRMNRKGIFDWKVLEYELAEPTVPYTLPLWAWGKNQGERRRFLSQDEALKALTQVGLGKHRYQADVMAGRVTAALFAPQITSTWRDKIPLREQDGNKTLPQNISGAQVGAWVSMQEHAQQLLGFHYFNSLENKAD